MRHLITECYKQLLNDQIIREEEEEEKEKINKYPIKQGIIINKFLLGLSEVINNWTITKWFLKA